MQATLCIWLAFQEKSDNFHYDSNLPTVERTKRRTIDVTVNEMVVSNIKTNVKPPLIDSKAVIEQNMACLYDATYFAWCWLHQHNSIDQVVSSYSGWILNEHDIKNLAKTILNCMQYLQKLAEEVNMPYINITLDMGAAINAFKVLRNRKEEFKNVVIHLGHFHFMKENFQASFFY